MADKVYIIWERSEFDDTYSDTIVDIYKDKTKAQRVADNLRHKIVNDPDNEDDSLDYFVEGLEVK